jgi:hypothetical protein
MAQTILILNIYGERRINVSMLFPFPLYNIYTIVLVRSSNPTSMQQRYNAGHVWEMSNVQKIKLFQKYVF